MKSAEYFAAGYALPLYSIDHDRRYWRFKDQEYTTTGAVQTFELEGLCVAQIDDVLSVGYPASFPKGEVTWLLN